MLVSKLHDALSIGKLKIFQEPCEILLAAIDDWPGEIADLAGFVKSVERLIGGETSRVNLESFLDKIDVREYAWQAESLSVLLDVFDYFEQEATLYEIVSEIESDLTG